MRRRCPPPAAAAVAPPRGALFAPSRCVDLTRPDLAGTLIRRWPSPTSSLNMRIRYAAKTDVGMKRTHNEDYFSLIEDEQLFLVADGMGGHASGEVASKMAAEVMREFYARTKDDDATWPYKMDRQLSYVENRLVVGIKMANQRIFEAAGKDIKYKGMGTTIVSCQVVGETFYIAHVGDSRCYRVRQGAIQQMTRDHSLLEDYKDAKPDMSDEEQRKFPHKNVITRALGMRETVQVDVLAHEITDQDLFLLCSDGLSGMVEDPKLLEVVVGAPSLEMAVSGLVDAANQAGGTDNVTVLALQCLASSA
jgi:protein phosphatase